MLCFQRPTLVFGLSIICFWATHSYFPSSLSLLQVGTPFSFFFLFFIWSYFFLLFYGCFLLSIFFLFSLHSSAALQLHPVSFSLLTLSYPLLLSTYMFCLYSFYCIVFNVFNSHIKSYFHECKYENIVFLCLL